MKAKIRKTGEIVEVVSYSGGTVRSNILDSVSYIDSKGVEHDREKLNYYWDFEQISDIKEDNISIIDWEQRRFELAKAAMVAMIGSEKVGRGEVTADRIVGIAHNIIEELRTVVNNGCSQVIQ